MISAADPPKVTLVRLSPEYSRSTSVVLPAKSHPKNGVKYQSAAARAGVHAQQTRRERGPGAALSQAARRRSWRTAIP